MAREKKITIKASLNQRIKGRRDSPLEELKYPLYLEVSYNRKFTKFPFGDNWFPLSEEENLKANPNLVGAINAVEKIIRNEIRRDEGFEVKGIAEVVKSYLSLFQATTLTLLIKHVEIELKKLLTFSDFSAWKSKPILEQLNSGLELIDTSKVHLIDDLLSSYQLLTLAEYSGSILEWVIYTSEEDRIKVVKKGLSKLKSTTPPLENHGGINLAAKKMSPLEISKAVTKMARLITDNKVFISVKYMQL